MAHQKYNGLQKILEDSRYPSFGPHLRLLGFVGLWHPNLTTITKIQKGIFYIVVLFFFSQYLKCFIDYKPDSIKMLLETAPHQIGLIKACYFQKDHGLWVKFVYNASTLELDQLSKNNPILQQIIKRYVHKIRLITYLYWFVSFFTNINFLMEPYMKNQLTENGTRIYVNLFDGYTPFGDVPPGYYISMIFQSTVGCIMSLYVIGWDTLVFSIMIFFQGQLKVARFYCVSIIEKCNIDGTQRNLSEFHRYYISLLRYHKMFSALISPIMFIYLFIISVNLGQRIGNIAKAQNDLGSLVSSFMVIMALMIQLLCIYWHSNEVITESLDVSYGVFESDWLEADKRLRKEIALLSVTTTKRLVFRAGPFTEMSLSTFVTILRASYSFYALLTKTSHENR